MTKKNENLITHLEKECAGRMSNLTVACDEVTIECAVHHIKEVLLELRDKAVFAFDQLMDLCGVDYLRYGQYDWETDTTTSTGFSRGVEAQEAQAYVLDKPRFAVVYHLLSTKKNHRLRVKVFVDEAQRIIPSVHTIWKVADWFEREAYDLFGLLFEGHPDLRRILTDYGFIGHPFRKDFPLSGHVEMRYDAKLQKVIYEPVDIVPRILVPKVIRNDNRYLDDEVKQS
jgi:NADH-quinone oxidoreductase subunit C